MNAGTIVFLPDELADRGLAIGRRRHLSHLGGVDYCPGSRELYGDLKDLAGALGEAFLAHYLGIFDAWAEDALELERRLDGDVGGYEVRTITDPGHHLHVKPKDPTGRIYVLVQLIGPVHLASTANLRGWARGTEAKRYPLTAGARPDWPPYHQLPNNALHAIEHLPPA